MQVAPMLITHNYLNYTDQIGSTAIDSPEYPANCGKLVRESGYVRPDRSREDFTSNGGVLMDNNRCEWSGSDPLYQAYHDNFWGEPVHDDRTLFEMLTLEGAQAGLSWITILKRQEGYRAAFDHFDPEVVAGYSAERVAALMADSRIIRNRAKIESTIGNARAFLEVQAVFGSFDAYIWRIVDGAPKVNCFQTIADIPAQTPESQAMSKDLLKRGFKFVGPTICYAYMQACGLVNDHTAQCFKYPCAR
jgi:DNA-3-methyladenine glycosylase I